MTSIKTFLVVALALIMTVACKTDTKDAARESLATASTTTTPAPATQAPAQAIPTGPLTAISYPVTEFNFGEIEEGEKVTHEFKFKNTGSEPLVISKAQGSCGCTVPDWPKEPIPPGEEGTIKVVYDSRGKGKARAEGGRAENKRVTITANTDPAQSFLYIKGKVYKPDAPSS